MTEEEQDAVLAGMVRERRALRLTIACLREWLETAERMLQTASGIAGYGASGQENAQTQEFETAEYPSAAELRGMVSELAEARRRVKSIDERLDA